MKLQIGRAYVEAMVAQFPELQMLAEQLKFGNKADIPFHHLSGTQLDFLRGCMKKQALPCRVKQHY